MTRIRSIYEVEPNFPATDQHPNAERFPVSIGIFRFADCVGGAPTQAELEAHLGLDAAGMAEKARLAADEAERAEAKADSQIASDLNMTPAEIASAIDAVFSTWTAPQKAFMRRLVRMVIATARKALR